MTATLNDRLCTEVGLAMPRYGNWRARVQLQDEDALPTTPGGVTLVVAGLTLTGTVLEQGERSGQRGAEVVGGMGGWSRPVPPLPHGLTANGVKLSTYVQALALAAGERMAFGSGVVDRPLGVVVARLGQQGAAELLTEVCASPSGAVVIPWWVDIDGTTRLGARTGAATDGEFTDAEDLDRWRIYTVDDASDLLPGGTIAGRTIEEIRIDASGDNVSVLATLATTGVAPQTFAAKLRRYALGLLGPRVAARTIYRYKVREVFDATRVRAVPVRALLAPDLPSLRIWPGIPGGRGRVQVGSEVLIQFADGDTGFPVLVGFAPSIAGTKGYPDTSEIDAAQVLLGDATEYVARLTDETANGAVTFGLDSLSTPGVVVVAFWPFGAIAPTSAVKLAVVAGNLTVTAATPADVGTVTGGLTMRGVIDLVNQSKVKA